MPKHSSKGENQLAKSGIDEIISETETEINDADARQKEIHKTLGYKDEFRKFLDDNGIEYDEDGLWE